MLVRELADLLGGMWEGDGDRNIRRVASLETAGPEDVTFVGSAKAAKAAAESEAGCLLTPPGYSNRRGQTVIRVPDPRAAIAQLIARLHPRRQPARRIHPTAVIGAGAILGEAVAVGPYAVIGEGAKVGSGTTIGAGSAIGDDVEIGRDCTLHARVTIYDNVTIGSRCVLHSGAVIGADGFGFVMRNGAWENFPQVGRVELGDDVEIGANSCVDRAALGTTSIGNGTKLDNMVHIGHNCRLGRHVVIAAQTGLAGGVAIGDYAVIGGQVGVGDKAHIESKAVVGSGAGILTSKIVRSGQVVWGTPARPLREYLEQLAVLAKLPDMRKEWLETRKKDAKSDV
ncbi:MAG: UDP-3-O-(3-hydroxymyristoyl)glucosamine N-acyltransferase [Acidobacteria bacterium]|nr:UDP-3-O-(3-hydroxymyristoyl)glucosamine N-acyltransferase [Acidobacteriota bacterium]